MKQYVRASEYSDHMTYTRNRVKFSVYTNNCNEDNPICKFQISELHPYDDADYVWAKCDGYMISYYQNGKKIDTERVFEWEPSEWEDYNEYLTELIDSTCIMLREYNVHVEPRMIHN